MPLVIQHVKYDNIDKYKFKYHYHKEDMFTKGLQESFQKIHKLACEW